MLSPRPAGRDAAARKYDIITALGAHALAGGKRDHRLVLRFLTLLTARYNWTRNELAVGQREIARLWCVDERTVKREMAKLRGCGWLLVKRQGARGRVTEYGLDLPAILEATRTQWPNVGPDFDLRMQGAPEPARVVALPLKGTCPQAPAQDGTEWALAQAILQAEDPGTYASWLHNLKRQERAGGRIVLRAPSRFHGAYVQTHLLGRLLATVQSVDADVSEIAVTV